MGTAGRRENMENRETLRIIKGYMLKVKNSKHIFMEQYVYNWKGFNMNQINYLKFIPFLLPDIKIQV